MMAFLLSIDCTGQNCSSALLEKDYVSAAESLPLARGHASHIVPQVARVVSAAGISMARIDHIVTPIGPGSFTGLRVGLAAARGLGLALDIPVSGVRVGDVLLDQMAARKTPLTWQLAVLDGKRAEPFVQFRDPETADVSAPFTATKIALQQHLAKAFGRPLQLAGNGSEKLLPLLAAAGFTDVNIITNELPDAASIGLWAWQRFQRGQAFWPPTPLYVRPPDVSQSTKPAGLAP